VSTLSYRILTVTSILFLFLGHSGPKDERRARLLIYVFVSTFRVRNRKELNASLKGATLGDADGDADDALKWIKKAKKKEKELAKKRREEMDNMDKAAQDEYSESKS
jgi:hypothetical protein